ncbi:MAG UNVERIFIED_CONTAM: DUF721 domain-containing protein [Rickettsiaceae bacterium]|jgi:hypothetical protein
MAKLLADSIGQILRQSIGGGNKVLSEIVINWHKIVGSDFSSHCYPTRIFSMKEKGQQLNVLYVTVNSSSIGLKLSYQQDVIIEKIAIYFGHKVVHKIKTKVAM